MGRYYDLCAECDAFDDLARRPGTERLVCAQCMWKGKRATRSKIPRPLPVCPYEFHRDMDWISREGLAICGRCHPPSHPSVVREKPDDLLCLSER